jgi:hypothetical protein
MRHRKMWFGIVALALGTAVAQNPAPAKFTTTDAET